MNATYLPLHGFLPAIQNLGSDYRLARSFWLASLVLILYDFILTVGDEILYMWRGRFVWTRMLFWLNRYWPLLNLVFDNITLATTNVTDVPFCTFWWRWFMYATIISRISISGILILRLYVIYRCNRKLLLILCTLFAAELSIECVLLVKIFNNLKPFPDFLLISAVTQQVTGCIPGSIASYAWAYWIPVLIFESVLFTLSLAMSIKQSLSDKSSPYLMRVLLRDSVIYFGGALGSILMNFVVWGLHAASLFLAFLPVVIVANSILGSRLMLHIQKASRRRQRVQQQAQELELAPYRGTEVIMIDSRSLAHLTQGAGDEVIDKDIVEVEEYCNGAPMPVPLFPPRRWRSSTISTETIDGDPEVSRRPEDACYSMNLQWETRTV